MVKGTPMSNKVIEFPKSKVVREVPEEHLRARQAKAEHKMADAIVDDVVSSVMTELDNCMIDIEDKQVMKDFVMVIDAIRACVYRNYGIEHPLHDFVDSNVSLIDGDIDSLSKEEIKTKIEQVIKDLNEAQKKLDEDDTE